MPAMSADLALQASLLNMEAAKGGPEVQHIPYSLEEIPLGCFNQPVRIFAKVTVIGGDNKDQVRANTAMNALLSSLTLTCNFTFSSGKEPPVESLVLDIPLIVDRGGSTTTNNRSDSHTWVSGNRHSEDCESVTACSSDSESKQLLSMTASASFIVKELDGSETHIGDSDDVFSAAEDLIAAAHQESGSNNRACATRRWGGSCTASASSSGSTYTMDSEYSRSQMARVTIPEAIKTAIWCSIAKGTFAYNATHKLAGASTVIPEAPLSVPVEGQTTSGAGETIYAVTEDVDPQ